MSAEQLRGEIRSAVRGSIEAFMIAAGVPDGTRYPVTNAMTDSFMTKTRTGLAEVLHRTKHDDVPSLEQLAEAHDITLPENPDAMIDQEDLGVLRRHVVYAFIQYGIGSDNPHYQAARRGATNYMGKNTIIKPATGVNEAGETYL
jgi:hypothetical protein